MATHQVEDTFGMLTRLLTIRIAVPARRLPALRCRPAANRPVVSRDEAQALLQQMLRPQHGATTPNRREADDLAVCSRIRKALYS